MRRRVLSDAERCDWLRLSESENVGPITFRQLIGRYGSAAAALDALPALSRKGGLQRPLRIMSRDAAEAVIDRIDELGGHLVAAGEAGYSPFLGHIETAPPLLCVKGVVDIADRPAVAIVGSRNASALGRKFTRQIAAEIAEAGFAIVSGLARGIDTAAHEASLESGTAAVLAGGIDVIYPPENEALHGSIARTGLLVTEMLPGTVPREKHFPRRNRIISGMARAVVVVEAALRSGSLITARLAAEQGREVFAVPGSPLDPRAEGCNRLIRDGAGLLTRASDVIDALRAADEPAPLVFREPGPDAAPSESEAAGGSSTLLALLSPSPVDVDDLIRECRLPPAAVIALLLELELAGRIVRHPADKVSLA